MEEIWRSFVWCGVDYAGFYEVSNLGQIRSVDRVIKSKAGWSRLQKGKILSSCTFNGYAYADLNKNGHSKTVLVHRVVAHVFIRPITASDHVHHLRGKTNNQYFSLEIMSNRKNSSIERTAKSGLPTGVHLIKQTNKYLASIWIKNRKNNAQNTHLGVYDNSVLASEAYQIALSEVYKNEMVNKGYVQGKINEFRVKNGIKPMNIK